ncbi:MAG: hypothetical protein MZV65_17645 [Chromatiales bacterium]|nr:hypothetical protein [Chromatiales bacterium]
MNVGNPDRAFDFAAIPNHGVGLARLEFIINRMIGVHPKALLEFDRLEPDLQRHDPPRRWPATPTRSSSTSTSSPRASARSRPRSRPKPVIVRLSDFKSNEYANLLGGAAVRAARGEPDARLPRRLALRRRGVPPVLRARVPRAEARARARWASTNVEVMVPFVRTRRARREQVVELLAANGLKRGENGLEVDHDVRDPDQRAAGRRVPRALRRLVDRLATT